MRKFRVKVNGSVYEVEIEELTEASGDRDRPALLSSAPAEPLLPTAARPVRPAAMEPGDGQIVAQMPGTIIEIKSAVGDSVGRGQPLLILEAMKMANEVVAPHEGVVREIKVEKGASVNAGDILVVLN